MQYSSSLPIRRLQRRGRMGFVPAAAHDHTILAQGIFREFLEGTQKVAASHAGINHLLFEARVSFRCFVVDFCGAEAVDEAAQSLKDTAEVTPYGSVRDSCEFVADERNLFAMQVQGDQ